MGISELRAWLARAPEGTTVPAASVLALLAEEDPAPEAPAPELAAPPIELTWRERLWLVPAETRLGTREILEALGRSRSWLYSHLGEDRGRDRLPHRKMDGELTFAAGEVRAWVRDHEDVVAAGPMESPPHPFGDGGPRAVLTPGGRR